MAHLSQRVYCYRLHASCVDGARQHVVLYSSNVTRRIAHQSVHWYELDNNQKIPGSSGNDAKFACTADIENMNQKLQLQNFLIAQS